MTYEAYKDGCKRFKVTNIYEDEKAFNRVYGITEVDTMPPLFIEPKVARSKKVEPTLKAHVKIQKPKKDKPVKAIKTKQPVMTKEQAKERKNELMRIRRANMRVAGLTSNGKEYKVKEPKKEKTIEEIRAERVIYARTYREKNREKHLQYRRDYRNRRKDEHDTK